MKNKKQAPTSQKTSPLSNLASVSSSTPSLEAENLDSWVDMQENENRIGHHSTMHAGQVK